MRINAEHPMARAVTVYLNGEKQADAFEVYIPGNVLEGEGEVIRAVLINGKCASTYTHIVPDGCFARDEIICEKVSGHIRIEVDDSFPNPLEYLAAPEVEDPDLEC